MVQILLYFFFTLTHSLTHSSDCRTSSLFSLCFPLSCLFSFRCFLFLFLFLYSESGLLISSHLFSSFVPHFIHAASICFGFWWQVASPSPPPPSSCLYLLGASLKSKAILSKPFPWRFCIDWFLAAMETSTTTELLRLSGWYAWPRW